MKRPHDAGRGLDGVAKRSPAYYNPAIDLLEEVASEKPGAIAQPSSDVRKGKVR
jgi:hypothetical protein